MIKKLVLFGFLLVCIFAGFIGYKQYVSLTEKKTSEQAVILLESIKKVTKLIAVEGYFSEVYDYKDYYGFDLSFFRKKALIRVKAKVSVGYDFEKLKVETNREMKTITISAIGIPQILSVDHTIDYYDISEGTFNSFSSDDYNRLNKNAKDYIISQVNKSDLMTKASQQKDQMIATLRTLVEGYGWQIIVNNDPFVK